MQRDRDDEDRPPDEEPRIHDGWFGDDPGGRPRRKKRPKRR
jgi:hypothetical protein